MKDTNCSCEPYIDLYRWKGQQVFVLKYKGSLCNWIPAYIREDGSYLVMPNGYNLMQLQQEGQFIRNIWTCGK